MSEMRAEWGRGMSLDHRDRDYLSLMLAVTITTVMMHLMTAWEIHPGLGYSQLPIVPVGLTL